MGKPVKWESKKPYPKPTLTARRSKILSTSFRHPTHNGITFDYSFFGLLFRSNLLLTCSPFLVQS